MKRTITLLAGICFALCGLAQEDSTKKESDTIRVGNMVIIKKKGKNDNDGDTTIKVKHKPYKPSKVSTNWGIVDLGVSQFTDKTNYPASIAQGILGPGANEDWFDLRNGKSINVNVWFFMQRISMVKNVVNLKYGLGLELNNYRYSENIKYHKNPTKITMDTINYSKNKLAADYLTIPMMLNFNFTPKKKHGFGFSVGASVGYLYASRQKTVSSQFGKQKLKDDFDLNKWKVSYVAELNLGPIHLYGSLATKSMFEKGLDQTPYNVGFRISN